MTSQNLQRAKSPPLKPQHAAVKTRPQASAKAIPPIPGPIIGLLEHMEGDHLEGWVYNPATPQDPVTLRVVIDGSITDVITCNLPRTEATAPKIPSRHAGFSYFIPERYQNGGRHVLKFVTIQGIPITLATRAGMAMSELYFCLPRRTHIEGVVDGVVDGLVQGWILSIDQRTRVKTGGLRVLITAMGQPVAELLADEFRGDVAEALGADSSCGFSFSPPEDLRHGRSLSLAFFAMPGRVELRGSPVTITFPSTGERQRINALIERADELFSYAYHLRRELKAALPAPRFMLSDYPRWAALTLPKALARSIARYGDLPVEHPLVSILCPVYRPDLTDFLTAIDSIRAQSYENWELILVDDASKDTDLTAVMQQLAKSDSRIKLFEQQNNAGISHATNLAIKSSSGTYIAFFDHDDALEPHALEIMLRAQSASGAKLLYSDEDKIDRSGILSEPHLKPDFNYRFLLELNYICHFVLADAALVRNTAPLNPLYDGAQDHDFLLRMIEHLQPGQIHHVAEILYHWRKSASSTASSGAAKPAAARAGELAVAAHLARRDIDATVAKRGNLTCYQIGWKPKAALVKKSGVSILIPFRDHIELTAACVEALRKHTKNVTYEIILLDNWSQSPEAERFCTEQANLANTKVIRIAEPFNYSRINNIGVKAAVHDYVLFLNNDVFVSNPLWLRIMLNELLINGQAAAVGAKLLYPNGTVQHAGVVLGVGGIADHAFRGLPGSAPGYVMRAMAAQQVSAVTAACMLTRKSAFEAVGGFDETELTVAFNDVDLCLKLIAANWQIIYTPDAVAEHQESISRGDDFNETKVARFMLENEVMRRRYETILPYDPFYNRHFAREGGVYRELRILEPENR